MRPACAAYCRRRRASRPNRSWAWTCGPVHKVQSKSGADVLDGMAVNVRTAVDSAGFATFYLPMLATDPDAALQTLGHVVHLAGVSPVQILGPKDPSFATPNTYSGNYGMGVFPLH